MSKLNETALAAAKDVLLTDDTTEDRLTLALTAYLAALPKPVKGVRPADNPNRREHTEENPIRPGKIAFRLGVNGFGVDNPAGNPALAIELKNGLDLLCKMTHTASFNAGWYTDPKTGLPLDRNVPEMLMLIVSEIAEGMEGYRKGLMDDHLTDRLQIEVEMADAVIRIGDLCGFLGLDLAGAVVAKMRYNASREDHKLETRAAGGKAF